MEAKLREQSLLPFLCTNSGTCSFPCCYSAWAQVCLKWPTT